MQNGGDEEVGVNSEGGDVWDKAMEPFDQDKEEGIKKEEELEEEMWQAAFHQGANEGMKAKVIRSGYNPTQREVE